MVENWCPTMVLTRKIVLILLVITAYACNNTTKVENNPGETFFDDVNHYLSYDITNLTQIANDTPATIFVVDMYETGGDDYYASYKIAAYMRYDAPFGIPNAITRNDTLLKNSEEGHFFWNKQILEYNDYFSYYESEPSDYYPYSNIWKITFPDDSVFIDTINIPRIIDKLTTTPANSVKYTDDLKINWKSNNQNKVRIDLIMVNLDNNYVKHVDTLVDDSGQFVFSKEYLNAIGDGKNYSLRLGIEKSVYIKSKMLYHSDKHVAYFIKINHGITLDLINE